MKEFRGSLVAIVLLIVVAGWYARQGNQEQEKNQETALFRFEKHDVQKVLIERPEGESIELFEKDGVWLVEGKHWRANPSMVNRIKHQLHDLDARTVVTEGANDSKLYGLGENGIRVSLTLSQGKTFSFLVGDPNPSEVSYYIQPLPGTIVYTVKKSAMDYFSHDLHAYRDPRFAKFDIKDAQEIHIKSEARELHIEKTGLGAWWLQKENIDVDEGEVRGILSKIAALKAVRYIDVPQGGLDYGLTEPLLIIRVVLPDREQVLWLGNSFQEGRDHLSYVQRKGDSTVYVVRAALGSLAEREAQTLRNKKILQVRAEEIIAIEGTLMGEATAKIEKKADAWGWEDGSLISGSTPERLATALADVRVLSFDEPKQEGTEQARLTFSTSEQKKTLYIGDVASEQSDEEGNVFQRYYAWFEEGVYTIDGHSLRVLNDLIREKKRKNQSDKKTEGLHDRMQKGEK